jgi:6-pyruvoyltetrahydropterin/6-carboxytetrahydropterin synthase
MLYITKKMVFSASHRLYNPLLSDEENFILFDKCSNPSGHGHNYTLEVTVNGEVQEKTGYVIDMKKLKYIIKKEIIDKVDHKNLNSDVDFLMGVNPTVENLVLSFWKMLENKIPNGSLYKMRLYETDSSFVDYYGNQGI